MRPCLRSESGAARAPQSRLEEAVGLARAIVLEVAHAEVIAIARPRPSTLLGKGAVERLAGLIAGAPSDNGSQGVGVAVVDGALTPVQQRNLERAWNCKVIDRTGLILEIFGARARTREGRLQVELAHLTYQRSRLVRSWTHLERQRGGFGFFGGPGETQIEADRRQISGRISRLKRQLKNVQRTRDLHRRARRRVPYPIIALVGYTNAGKSTLFNTLTRARTVVADRLFATLDPTMRGLGLPSGRKAILSDTVGFVSELPHELIAAFRATLEEVCEADVIVHVRDAHHVDSEVQKEDVHRVLRELDLADALAVGLIEVFNKIDLLSEHERMAVAKRAERANVPMVPVSALSGDGCAELLAVLDHRLSASASIVDVTIAPDEGASLAWLYDHGEVIERHDEEEAIRLKVRLLPADAARFAKRRHAEA
ncbi:MAG: GTPase HflX [Rhodospirillales bacterium]|nr:GTPase HflX [Rhodospirillales bacterium]